MHFLKKAFAYNKPSEFSSHQTTLKIPTVSPLLISISLSILFKTDIANTSCVGGTAELAPSRGVGVRWKVEAEIKYLDLVKYENFI